MNILFKTLLSVVFALSFSLVQAHPGGTDADGCHKNSKTNRKHCHDGSDKKKMKAKTKKTKKKATKAKKKAKKSKDKATKAKKKAKKKSKKKKKKSKKK